MHHCIIYMTIAMKLRTGYRWIREELNLEIISFLPKGVQTRKNGKVWQIDNIGLHCAPIEVMPQFKSN